MKMLYIANARMPSDKAHGIQLAKMCEAFLSAGVELTLLLPRLPDAKPEPIEAYYRLSRPVPVVRVPVLYVAPSTRIGFNMRALSFALTSFLYALWVSRRERDLVIYTIDLDQFSFCLLPLVGRPVCVEMHGSKRPTFFVGRALRRMRGVVAVSEGVAHSLTRAFNLRPGRVLVAPNGIDLAAYRELPSAREARKRLALPAAGAVLLYVGRLYDWKGLEVIPQGAPELPLGSGLYVVGGDAGELQRVTGVSQLPAQVRCVGQRDFSEIPLWLAAADLLLLTGTRRNTYSYAETSPMKLFEYLAAGKPVLAARTPAIESIVSPQEVLFYEPDDAADFARQARYALGHPGEMAARAQRGRAKVVQYAWGKRAERILAHLAAPV